MPLSFGALACGMDGLWTGNDDLACVFWVVGITIGVVSLPMYRAFFPKKILSDAELDELQDYVEQINKMTYTGAQKMGVIIATGEELSILRFSQSMLDLLKISGPDSRKLPRTVSELLPHHFRGPHAAMLTNAFKKGSLPDHLSHPLKNVDLLFPDGKCRKVNVSLGKLGGRWGSDGTLEGAIFSAVVSLVGVASPPRSPVRSPRSSDRKASKNRNFIERFALHMYGRQVGESLTTGTLPPTENHSHAGVMFVKWTCNSLEGGSRLTSVHVEIERLLAKHCIRRIQSWGDCYLVVTGTNFVEGDVANSTVSRLAAFACEAFRTLRLEGTLMHMTFGIHSGPVSIVFIPSASRAPSMTVFGDTVNTAARMQQCSEDGLLHMTALAGTLLHEQTNYDGDLTIDVMDIKSKGKMETVWYDCTENKFLTLNPRLRIRRAMTGGFGGSRLLGEKLTSNVDIAFSSSEEDDYPPLSLNSPTPVQGRKLSTHLHSPLGRTASGGRAVNPGLLRRRSFSTDDLISSDAEC